MAQVKLLKISSLGLPTEFDSAADEITLVSYTVDGGGPVLDATGLDLNNQDISDIDILSFNDPTSGSITITSGTYIPDDMMFDSRENVMETTGAILFPTITDDADQVDSLRVPALAGAPSATPTDGGEGYMVWDSTNDRMYVWDGATWKDQSIVEDAERLVNIYTAGTGGVSDRDVLYVSGADTVLPARSDADATCHEYIGFARGAAIAAADVEVVSEGLLGGFTGLTAATRYFIDASTAGAITATAPSGAGNNVIQVGVAKNTTTLHVRFQFMGKKAL